MKAGAVGMLSNRGIDVERQGHGGAAVFTRNARRGSCADTLEERFDLKTQRLAREDLGLFDMQAGKTSGSGSGFRGCFRVGSR